MLRAVAVVLAITRPAFADDVETRERAELASLVHPFQSDGFHARAFAQLTGASTDDQIESDLAAGGELRLAHRRCDFVRVGGQGRIGIGNTDDTSDARWRTSAEQWASFCIPISIFEVGHHLEWDVRPKLLAPLSLRPGLNRRETVTFRWQPLRLPLSAFLRGPTPQPDAPMPKGDLVIFDVDIEASWLWSEGGSLAARQVPAAYPFRYVSAQRAAWGEPRDLTVDIGAGGGVFVDDGASVYFWGLRIENLAAGPLFLTGGIGLVSGSAGEFISDVEREISITEPRAVIGVEGGGEHVHGHLRGTHDVTLAADGYVTVDSRAAAGLGLVLGKTRIDAEGAIAKTTIHVPQMPVTRAGTGGASLAIAHPLTSYLHATLRLEAAQSFYAARVAAADFTPRWGMQAVAGLAASAGR